MINKINNGNKITKHLLFLITVAISIGASHETIQKRDEDILNVVSLAKPIQKLIRDYLDLPDNLIHTVKMPRRPSISWAYPFFAVWPDYWVKTIFIRNILTGLLYGKVPINKESIDRDFALSPEAQYLAYADECSGLDSSIDVYDVKKQKLIIKHSFKKWSKYNFLKNNGLQFIVVSWDYYQGEISVVIYDTKSKKQIYNFMQKVQLGIKWNRYSSFLGFSEKNDACVMLLSEYLMLIFLVAQKKLINVKLSLQNNDVYRAILCANGKYRIASTNLTGLLQNEANTVLACLPNSKQQSFDFSGHFIRPIDKSCFYYPFFNPFPLEHGAYLVVSNHEPQEIISVFKNQAVDLDCPRPNTIDATNNQDSQCAIS